MIRFLQRVAQSIRGYGTGYARVNQLGLRLLGVVYLIAFVSYDVQAKGLIGANGILPFAEWLTAIKPRVAEIGFHHVPTLLWFAPTDEALRICLWAGILFSLLLILGVLPWLSTIALWALYLSVVTVGRVFWSYQWDNLLLEAGFLAILAAPWRVRMRWRAPDNPPRLAIFLMHWLVFRLMFLSGYVKLASGDEAWRNLTALTYHYWTQPLPIWTAWYAHQLPLWFHKLSCAAMFAIELACPFLIWLGGRARAIAALSFIGLMALIAATGNYTFFNLLTAILSLWLIRDDLWASMANRIRGRAARFREFLMRRDAGSPVSRPIRIAQGAATVAVGVPVLMLSVVLFFVALRIEIHWPRSVSTAVEATAPFRTVNNYGLFAVMTKTRPEIILEGTWDGQAWFPYEFRWKPGDLTLRPRLVAPHQPRLDWQMWFAALGSRQGNPWLIQLMVRLLQNEPAVLDLLAYNPFEQKPPLAIRAVRYDYRFATPAEREELGVWWMREYKDLYCPPIQLHPML